MAFNQKNKFNYDKEYGANEVYQFIFGKEHLEFLRRPQRPKEEPNDLDIVDV